MDQTELLEFRKQAKAMIGVIHIISETIRELKQVPSGYLYAQVMNHVTATQYAKILEILTNAQVITISNHLITWVGPKPEETPKNEDHK